MIKIINKRPAGQLFHYAHFLYDCLFNEILNNVQNYKIVYREKNVDQTIGNFCNIYEEVINVKNIELSKDEFDKIDCETLTTTRFTNPSITEINLFRDFIFNRYNIISDVLNNEYPEVILIKRGFVEKLVDDEELDKNLDKKYQSKTNGVQRREIFDIDKLEEYLQKKIVSFKSVILENIPFKEQVKYFKNAKIVIYIHGAAVMNMLFCNKDTLLIEVRPDISQMPTEKLKQLYLVNPDLYYNPDYVTNFLQTTGIKRIKCENELNEIIRTISKNF